MRSLLILVVLVALVGGFLYYTMKPSEVTVKVAPTPTPRPASSIAGMGEGAKLLGDSKPAQRVNNPSSIIPQTTPVPGHH